MNYLWKMRGYPQISFWISITLVKIYISRIIINRGKNPFELVGTALNCLYSETRVMLKLGRRPRGHLVTLIKICVYIISENPGYICWGFQKIFSDNHEQAFVSSLMLWVQVSFLVSLEKTRWWYSPHIYKMDLCNTWHPSCLCSAVSWDPTLRTAWHSQWFLEKKGKFLCLHWKWIRR